MSIRQVNCPACKSVANIPATMTNIQCPSCGHIWNVNQPQTAATAKTQTTDGDESGNGGTAAMLAVVTGGIVLLAIAGILLVLFLPVKEPPAPAAEPAAAEPAPSVVADYREIDLPKSTRKEIYRDYRMMARSSIEKKLPIPKGSPVRTSLEEMLQKTADREVTHFALLHNITEDDVMQIVAEGDAKQWPGSRKPEPKPENAK